LSDEEAIKILSIANKGLFPLTVKKEEEEKDE